MMGDGDSYIPVIFYFKPEEMSVFYLNGTLQKSRSDKGCLTKVSRRVFLLLWINLCFGQVFSQSAQKKQIKGCGHDNQSLYAYNEPVKRIDKKYSTQNGLIFIEEDFSIQASRLENILSPAGTPCTAHRWFAGDGWRQNVADCKIRLN